MKIKQYIVILAFAFAGGIIGGLLFCQFFIGTAAIAETGIAKEIKAEKFYLVNKAGNAVAGFYLSPFGNPIFWMFGKKKATRLLLTNDRLAFLVPGSKLGANTVSLQANEEESIIKVVGRNGVAVQIKSGENTANIEVKGKNGNQAVLGNCKLLNKETGTEMTRPASSMVLFNKDGNVVWSTPE